MLINSIRLENYACFENIYVEFKENFTVIVGKNGSGKTALLNGIRDFLEVSLRLNLDDFYDLKNPRLCTIKSGSSIRFEEQYPIKIITKTTLLKNSELKENIYQKSDASFDRATYVGESIDVGGAAATDDGAAKPLAVFYRADRHWSGAFRRGDTATARETTGPGEAFDQWDGASTGSTALRALEVAKTVERPEPFRPTGRPVPDSDLAAGELWPVNQAIAAVIPEAEGMSRDLVQGGWWLKWRDGAGPGCPAMPFEMLSSGERVVIGLVADLARRACRLNPHLGGEAVSKTPGVVLIDELESHLHPNWRRRLPKGLKAAFPAMQFIATTNSPLIVGELTPSEIVILDNFKPYTPESSYGLNSDHILVSIFGTSYRPDEIDSELKVLFKAIDQGELEKAKTIIRNLSDKAPGILEIDGAKALIMRKEAIGR